MLAQRKGIAQQRQSWWGWIRGTNTNAGGAGENNNNQIASLDPSTWTREQRVQLYAELGLLDEPLSQSQHQRGETSFSIQLSVPVLGLQLGGGEVTLTIAASKVRTVFSSQGSGSSTLGACSVASCEVKANNDSILLQEASNEHFLTCEIEKKKGNMSSAKFIVTPFVLVVRPSSVQQILKFIEPIRRMENAQAQGSSREREFGTGSQGLSGIPMSASGTTLNSSSSNSSSSAASLSTHWQVHCEMTFPTLVLVDDSLNVAIATKRVSITSKETPTASLHSVELEKFEIIDKLNKTHVLYPVDITGNITAPTVDVRVGHLHAFIDPTTLSALRRYTLSCTGLIDDATSQYHRVDVYGPCDDEIEFQSTQVEALAFTPSRMCLLSYQGVSELLLTSVGEDVKRTTTRIRLNGCDLSEQGTHLIIRIPGRPLHTPTRHIVLRFTSSWDCVRWHGSMTFGTRYLAPQVPRLACFRYLAPQV
eukprot:PhF_6_TR23237/c0_g1_i3/m.32555